MIYCRATASSLEVEFIPSKACACQPKRSPPLPNISPHDLPSNGIRAYGVAAGRCIDFPRAHGHAAEPPPPRREDALLWSYEGPRAMTAAIACRARWEMIRQIPSAERATPRLEDATMLAALDRKTPKKEKEWRPKPRGKWKGWDGNPAGLLPMPPLEHDAVKCAAHPPQTWPKAERWPHDCRGGVHHVRPRHAPSRAAARGKGDYQDADGNPAKTPRGKTWDGLPWSLVGQDGSSPWTSHPRLPQIITRKPFVLARWGDRPLIVLYETAWDALLEAVESYDPERGKFITHAWSVIVKRIESEIKRTRKNRRDDRVPAGSVALLNAAGLISDEQWSAVMDAFYGLHSDDQTVLMASGYYPDDERWPVRRMACALRDWETIDVRRTARLHESMAQSRDGTLPNRTIAMISGCARDTVTARFNEAMAAYKRKAEEKLALLGVR